MDSRCASLYCRVWHLARSVMSAQRQGPALLFLSLCVCVCIIHLVMSPLDRRRSGRCLLECAPFLGARLLFLLSASIPKVGGVVEWSSYQAGAERLSLSTPLTPCACFLTLFFRQDEEIFLRVLSGRTWPRTRRHL